MTSILPNGKYYIQLILGKKGKKIEKIIFTDMLKNSTEFKIEENELRNPIVRNKKWKNFVDFKQFGQFFKVISEQTKDIQYKDAKESSDSIRIKKASDNAGESVNIILTIKKINDVKAELIQNLSGEGSLLLTILLDKLMLCEDLSQEKAFVNKHIDKGETKKIRDLLNELINLNSKIGNNKTREELLNEVLVETNYLLLINKAGTIDTVRIISLLTEAHERVKSMEDKDIIAFFGSTGSGKSTSVNYFMGIPLKKGINSIGEQVVTINEEELKTIKAKEKFSANIGHSIGTSETIYSQGHRFIEESLSSDIMELCSNVMLCDNPGFNDTRGTNYEICTNMSIDIAIERARSIKSIILVVDYHTLTSERANSFINLIELMKERFPTLLKKNSDTFNCFNILITKTNNSKQIEGFRNRLAMHIAEEGKGLVIAKEEKNNYGISVHANRFEIFDSLMEMFVNDRIKFINVTDHIEREELLKFYIKNEKGVDKKRYKRAMEGGELQNSFMQQLSMSAHTWANLILYPFSNTIPEKIRENENLVKKYSEDIKEKGEHINNLENESIQYVQDVKNFEESLKNISLSLFNIDSTQILMNNATELSDPDELDYKKNADDFKEKKYVCESNLEALEKKVKKAKDEINENSKKKSNLESKKLQESEKLMQYKKGITNIYIWSLPRYEYGTTVNYNHANSHEERERAIEMVEELPSTEHAGFFIAGQEEHTLLWLPVIERNYALVPNNTFDPNSYIKNWDFSDAKYKAQIEANNVRLKKINKKSTLQKYPIKVSKY